MEKNSLSIVQQYPMERFNLLVPMETVAEIADIHKPVMNVVQISTNLNDKEIYEQEKAWTEKNGTFHPSGYALTKKGLNKLMRAAGIKILGTRPIVPSTCQKCAEINKNIGRPVNCGSCGNRDADDIETILTKMLPAHITYRIRLKMELSTGLYPVYSLFPMKNVYPQK